MKKIVKIVLFSVLSLQIVLPFVLPVALWTRHRPERAEGKDAGALSASDRKELEELMKNLKTLETPLEIRNTISVNDHEIGFDLVVAVALALHVLLFVNGAVFVALLVGEIVGLRRGAGKPAARNGKGAE